MPNDLYTLIRRLNFTGKRSLRQGRIEVTSRNGSSVGILLTYDGDPLTVASASVDIELLREDTGTVEKKRVFLTKGETDGFYKLKLKDSFSSLVSNRIYSCLISSGATDIDPAAFCVNVKDGTSLTEILEGVSNLKRYSDHRDMFKKKELTNAASLKSQNA